MNVALKTVIKRLKEKERRQTNKDGKKGKNNKENIDGTNDEIYITETRNPSPETP